MIPFVRPQRDYLSAAPYVVSHEWADGRIDAWAEQLLVGALWRWFNLADEDDIPDRRLITDARGVHILGWARGEPGDTLVISEVIALLMMLAPQFAFHFIEWEMVSIEMGVFAEMKGQMPWLSN